MNASPGGYAAPAELKCSSRKYPVSGPFLESPFGGWASFNSFVDHDQPDYSVDGEIVLANGAKIFATDGQESDSFPGYWSPSLRQYINYDGHNGYDFGISYQPVLAAAAGTVMYAGWNSPDQSAGYGQMILIDHHNGYVTLYGHLSSLEVSKGDRVTPGEEIGISGTTGNSSGPHLHFSVFHNCNVTDPYGWTGSSKDPLLAFDDEHAAYLWLPGHDPLVLNTPPNWPSYPLGLKVALPPGLSKTLLSPRAVPPVDRLLLLTLPVPQSGQQVSAGLALARTESAMSQEAEALTPYLDDLKAQGLIQGYQVVPAAAAIWVRGTASSQQLEGLPGVASLSGVLPQDLRAGQAGLAHSVLIQLGQRQAPSLWPVGFRSALHAWRPVITAVSGHALVEGFGLPGQRVTVSAERGGSIPAAGDATGDAQTGGFVATLQDAAGRPWPVRPGDVVQVQTGGRSASVVVSGLRVRVHGRSVYGTTRPGATVPVSVLSSSSSRIWNAVASADSKGRFSMTVPASLPAGSLAVASVTDGAGDEEAAASHVPGMVIDTTAQSLTGWAVTRGPDLQIWRAGKEIVQQGVTPSQAGVYMAAFGGGASGIIRAGDAISVGSRWHRHRVILPALSVRLPVNQELAQLVGPPRGTLDVELTHRGHTVQHVVTLDTAGHGTVRMPAPIAVGDCASVSLALPSGDTILASSRVRGVVVHLASSRVAGQTAGDASVHLEALSAAGAVVGRAVAQSDARLGSYLVLIRNAHGRRVHLAPGMKIVVRDPNGVLQITVPRLDIRPHPSISHVQVEADGARLVLSTLDSRGRQSTRRLTLGASGSVGVRLPNASHLKSVTISTTPADGVSFERTMKIRPRVLCAHVHAHKQACSARATRARH